MRTVLCLSVGLLLQPAVAEAQHQEHGDPSDHAGAEDREIKALSSQEVEALLAGDGAGYALVAELNHHPGPRHVLDLRDELGLSEEQEAEIREIHEEMHQRARELGRRLVEKERELDRLFAEGAAEEAEVGERLRAIGELEGKLRHAHVRAHLRTTELLDRHQIHLYDRQRGYDHDAGHHEEHHHEHHDSGDHRDPLPRP